MSEAAVASLAGAGHSPGTPPATAPAPRALSAPRDAFPHTRRPLPWLLAGFLAMLFFVPIDATELNVHLGVDSNPDRFAVIGLILAWLWFGGDQRAFLRTRRSKLFVTAACVFLAIAVASFLLDAPRIVNLGEFELVTKKFALLGSFLALSWFALTALRFEDLRGFATYLIGLAVLMSIGMLIERRTGYNVFYEWSSTILRPIANVAKSPTNINASPATEGRITVVGPTLHGLAATTMLVLVMPFALVRLFDPTSRRSWWLNVIAIALMLAAAVATDRKTALLVPVALVIYMAFYRPRQVLRLAPLGFVLLGLAHFASPGSLGTILDINADVKSNSTTHREGDFTSVLPDVLAHPALGRGYGALNADQPSQFRINDDQYVDEVWETGVAGLLAFLWMILAPVVLARGAIRSREPTIAPLALAASGGCVAFLVVCALFDSMGFTEAPYMFFVMAAMTTIASAGPAGNVKSSRQPTRGVAGERTRPPTAARAAVGGAAQI
jgi:hypothetical protein